MRKIGETEVRDLRTKDAVTEDDNQLRISPGGMFIKMEMEGIRRKVCAKGENDSLLNSVPGILINLLGACHTVHILADHGTVWLRVLRLHKKCAL